MSQFDPNRPFASRHGFAFAFQPFNRHLIPEADIQAKVLWRITRTFDQPLCATT
jgi:hypothetical protein